MNLSDTQTWEADWPDNVRTRVRELGFQDISELFAAYPALPLYKVARKLGPNIAAVQLLQLRFAEVLGRDDLREVCRDLLCRVLHSHLRKGWKAGLHFERMMAGAYSEWLSTMEFRTGAKNLRSLAMAVWNALENSSPPSGWLPSVASDELLAQAVEKGMLRALPEDGRSFQ